VFLDWRRGRFGRVRTLLLQLGFLRNLVLSCPPRRAGSEPGPGMVACTYPGLRFGGAAGPAPAASGTGSCHSASALQDLLAPGRACPGLHQSPLSSAAPHPHPRTDTASWVRVAAVPVTVK